MALSAGTRLGPYEIVSALGAGMGEVYRARDTKLVRDVALKILPDSFAHDSERLARFRREAQVLATLNHPHIGTIYGLEEIDGRQFLVLEMVDGESLDKRIARRMPVDDALAFAKQIADALEAAHENGIIHRDLKPANIALTKDGQVKVLDFGLAKATEAKSGISVDLASTPTVTSPAMMTGVGVILGTAAYMAPEQAKGHAADKRSDVWAFGCVLFDMLTGRQAFAGSDVTDTLAYVITKEPDWSALPTNTPASVRRLLRRCLEEDRKRRLADIADARLELDDARRTPTASETSELRADRSLRSTLAVAGWVVASVLAVVTAGIGWWYLSNARDGQTANHLVRPLRGVGSGRGGNLRGVSAIEGASQISCCLGCDDSQRRYCRRQWSIRADDLKRNSGGSGEAARSQRPALIAFSAASTRSEAQAHTAERPLD